MIISKIKKILRPLLCMALIILTIVYPLFMDSLTAYGWILNAGNYGEAFTAYGIVTLVCNTLLLAACILCLCKRDRLAIVLGTVGILPFLFILRQVTTIADNNGWGPQTAADFGQLASEIWSNRMLPTLFPYALILLLSLLHFFSYEASVARKAKKAAKLAKENAPAPRILGD